LTTYAVLEGEVELFNGLEIGEVCATRELFDTSFGAMSDLLGQQLDQKLSVSPAFDGSTLLKLGIDAGDRSEAKSFENGAEIDVFDIHHAASLSATVTAFTV